MRRADGRRRGPDADVLVPDLLALAGRIPTAAELVARTTWGKLPAF